MGQHQKTDEKTSKKPPKEKAVKTHFGLTDQQRKARRAHREMVKAEKKARHLKARAVHEYERTEPL
jgi:hypothetical protein